jgi:hypothetical protein
MPAAMEWGKVGQLLWVAPLAGLAVSLTFALLLLGVTRAGEARRGGAAAVAAAYSALAAVATAAFVGVVVYGVVVIAQK